MSSATPLAAALAAHQRGDWPAAIAQYRKTLKQDPKNAKVLHLMGLAELAQGQPAAAEPWLRKALAADPGQPTHHASLGECLRLAGRLDDAIGMLTQAGRRFPDAPWIWQNLGSALKDAGRMEEAGGALQHSVALKPNAANLHLLGQVLCILEHYPQAVEPLQRALKLAPGHAGIQAELGFALCRMGQVWEGMALYEQALKSAPGNAALFAEMAGVAALQMNQVDKALGVMRRALAAAPHDGGHWPLFLLMLHYRTLPAAEIFAEHAAWGARYDKQPRLPRHTPQAAGRRLRVGYVSGDFKKHPVAYFMEPILRHHDRATWEVHCYDTLTDAVRADEMTLRLKGCAEHWHRIAGLSDDDAAALIHRDGMDILVDLGGHAGGRLGVFARKPAPVQVAYLGYPDTTGLKAMDFRLVDAVTDPPGLTERHNTETLVRLPGCFLCYSQGLQVPVAQTLPMEANGFVTFGYFNAFQKASPEWIEMAAGVLKAVPNSRLMVKCGAFRSGHHAGGMIAEAFAPHGIGPERLQVLPKEHEMADHLARYHGVDIALDAFPYNGTTTTCDALWMGVPVVTLAGDIHVSRVSASILTAVGLPGWVAQTPAEFVRLAVSWAHQPEKLREIRQNLRARFEKAMDGAVFTAGLEAAYRDMIEKMPQSP